MRSVALNNGPWVCEGGLRNRLDSIGVNVSDTKPDTRIAVPIVTANSWNSRPRIPPMNSRGMNTAVSDTVIARIVNATSADPSYDAFTGSLPSSIWRTMFSSMTMASSTTKPTASVSAISEMLSRLKPHNTMPANVPTIDTGSAKVGMSVADARRKNRKITSTTRKVVSPSVISTSSTDWRTEVERSARMSMLTEGGMLARNTGSNAFTLSTTCTVLAPGCRWTASTIERLPLYQEAESLLVTESTGCAMSWMRTGAPSR